MRARGRLGQGAALVQGKAGQAEGPREDGKEVEARQSRRQVMPTMPLRACSYPGCPALVPRGRCAAHPYPRKEDTRPAERKQAYGPQWYKQRAAFLRAHPICMIKRKCRGAPATEVDHKVPLSSGGSRSNSNLQAACKPCHSSKTARQDTHRNEEGRFDGHDAEAVHRPAHRRL